ncbi:hypothetical protein [Bacillus sp. V59.32b]|uniref:hypothetical protein n=1 Tax=Bacillus sp. V59.32b TaxID=1758642 RepID=UPI000E3E7151|nr:hypothetical protein [Bacillus sp. V59.32b]RFU64325.1 hypothetical protein D0463_10250 [Bacillus sp. V59.32b]
MLQADTKMHPTIKRCLKHLDILGTDDKTRQIVYMYMETLIQEFSTSEKLETADTEPATGKNEKRRI